MPEQTYEMNDETAPQRVIIGVGRDMTERILTFNTPPRVELMRPIVAKLLSRDFSFTEISDAKPVMVDDQPSATESFMSVQTSHPNDWVAPPVINGKKLENGTIIDKTGLSVEAVRFAVTALHSKEALAA